MGDLQDVRSTLRVSWPKRIAAVFVALGAIAAGGAAFTGNLQTISDYVRRILSPPPPALGSVTMREFELLHVEAPKKDLNRKIKISVGAVYDKVGDAPVRGCLGQITAMQDNHLQARTVSSDGGSFDIDGGQHQKLVQYDFQLDPWDFSGLLSLRLTCSDLITDWYPVTRIAIIYGTNVSPTLKVGG